MMSFRHIFNKLRSLSDHTMLLESCSWDEDAVEEIYKACSMAINSIPEKELFKIRPEDLITIVEKNLPAAVTDEQKEILKKILASTCNSILSELENEH